MNGWYHDPACPYREGVDAAEAWRRYSAGSQDALSKKSRQASDPSYRLGLSVTTQGLDDPHQYQR